MQTDQFLSQLEDAAEKQAEEIWQTWRRGNYGWDWEKLKPLIAAALRTKDEQLAKECADWKKAYVAMCDDYNAEIAKLKGHAD